MAVGPWGRAVLNTADTGYRCTGLVFRYGPHAERSASSLAPVACRFASRSA